MATCKIKRLALLPTFRVTLLDPATGNTGMNLAGATVTFRMRLRDTDVSKVSATATVIDAANGVVEYVWTGTDTDTAGEYEGDWRATIGGKLGIWPSEGYDRILITDDVGP